MAYRIPYEADFKCSKGHEFVATTHPFDENPDPVFCHVCYKLWIAANVTQAERVGPHRQAKERTQLL